MKIFTHYGASAREQVTIRTNDILFVSDTLLKRFNADKCCFVTIFIDEENAEIGLEFHDNKPTNVHRKVCGEKSGISINIAPILRYFNIKKLDRKYIANIRKDGKLLVFSIRELKTRT